LVTNRGLVAAGLLAILPVGLSERGANAQGLGAIRSDPDPISRQPRLGRTPGGGANPLGTSPGAEEAILEGKMGAPGPRFIPEPFPQILPEITTESGPGSVFGQETVTPPARLPAGPLPSYGLLALPRVGEDDGPPDGLTLDQAIERLLRVNLDLYSKRFEIPQAEADILTASLRANPVFYSDVQCVPYGSFSLKRPGGQTQYDLNVTYPLDVTRKRRARTLVACQAKKVLQAQLQDAVRLQIDNLYTEYVDVLASRETVREARKSVDDLESEPAAARRTSLVAQGRLSPLAQEHLRLDVQREAAEIALADAQERFRADLRTLGALLQLKPAEAERLQVRGSLHDSAPPPAPAADLVRLALVSRPDLVAYRLGVGRAEADVKLALANRYPDLFLLYQPYTFQDDTPLRRKNATSWGMGLAVPLPLFNRNQGNIQRARLNVSQTQAELAALEDQVVFEVRQAERLYTVTRAAVERIERSLLPKARQEHDRVEKLYLAGKASELDFLTAERDQDQVVHQYRDTLVRHRRSMLN
jgi:outer membrane protein, heavy metal efflux system